MKPVLLLCLLASICLAADPTYWENAIPNGQSTSPPPREFHSLTNIPGTSYNVLFGGDTYNATTFSLNDTWVLETNSLMWKEVSPEGSPPARAYHVAGVTSDGEVIIFGGQNEAVPRTFYNDVWRYNLSSNTWTQDVFTLPSVLIPRSSAAGVVVGDSLYVFGGFVPAFQAVTNDLWSYNLTNNKWSLHSLNGRAGAPKPRQDHSAVYFNDATHGSSIIFFGGYNGTGGMSDTWQYVISTSNWIQLTKDQDPSGPHPRWGQSATMISGANTSIAIFGGSYVGGQINPYYSDVWYLQLAESGWEWMLVLPDGSTLGPERRGGHSSVLSADGFFTFGGYAMYIGFQNDLWELENY